MSVTRYGEPYNFEAPIGVNSAADYVKYEDYEKLLRALKVSSQANRELLHAMETGPKWYTRGLDGMYNHCWSWLLRALEASKPYDEEIVALPEISK